MTPREILIQNAIQALTELRTDLSIDRILELIGTLDMDNNCLQVRSWNDVRLIMNQIHFELSKISL